MGLGQFWGLVQAGHAETPRTVLTVYGENRLHPAITIVDERLRTTVQEYMGAPVDFLTEFLDVDRFTDTGYEDVLADFLRGKYRRRHVDVIVAGGPTALTFLLRHRADLFSATPVVHMVVDPGQLKALTAPPDVVGVPVDSDPLPTLELALRLRPGTRRLILVTGTANWDRAWERQLREALPRLPGEVRAEFLAGLPMEEVLERLRRLPPDAAVFVPTFFRDGAGRSFVSGQAAARIAAAAPVPVYGPYSTYLGKGIVGGYMPTFEEIGVQAGLIVQRILNGEAPGSLSLPGAQPNHYRLDWRQLRRFGIDEKNLPAGSILQFREPTFWEAYRERVVAVIVVFILQTVLIAALLLERRLRQRASAELRDSERRMHLAAEATGVGLWVWDTVSDDIQATPKARELHGIPETEPVDFARFLRTLHPADREATRHAIATALADRRDYEIQYRLMVSQNEIHWITTRGQVEPGSVMGASFDITARKTAELAAQRHRDELVRVTRAGLLGQLSGAIAHELGQPLTAILANAQAGQRLLEREPFDREEIRDIFDDILEEDQRAVEVIRRLGALFKQGGLQRQSLALNEVVREVLKLAHSDLLARHVALQAELAEGLPSVWGDRVQLQQVLLNLVVNACESMADHPPGQSRLTVRTSRNDAGQLVVEVADVGPGIGPEAAGRLFEPFFTTKPQGMGMGLAISRSIVEAHGGELTAANNEGPGATFRIILPGGDAPVP